MKQGSVLKKTGTCANDNLLTRITQKLHLLGTAMLLYMVHWSCPKVMDGVKECNRFRTEAQESHNITLQLVII